MKKILLASALVLAVSVGQSQALMITFDFQSDPYSGKTSPVAVDANNKAKPGYVIETFDYDDNTIGKTYDIPVYGSEDPFKLSVEPGGGFVSLNTATDIMIYKGSFAIKKGSEKNVNAAPAGDSTYYAFAPAPGQLADVEIGVDYSKELASLGLRVSYLGLYYGSIDTYNSLAFYTGDKLIQTTDGFLQDGIISGTEILTKLGGSSGDQTGPGSNVYVNLFFDANDPVFTSFRLLTSGVAFEVDNIAVGFTPVPEPATMLLFGAGLAGLAGFRRKRNK